MAILDDIDAASPEELEAGVYHVLSVGTADRPTFQRLHNRRLIPALVRIVRAGGRPPAAPAEEVPPERASRVLISGAHLLGEIATPQDREAVEALLELLDSAEDRIKMAAALALGTMGAAEAASKVTAFAEHVVALGDLGGVAKVSRALAGIGGEEAKASLEAFAAQHREAEDAQVKHVVAQVDEAVRSIEERLA